MNENISHNFFIWEEKNSTEPQKNYENKKASETKDTTNDIQTNVENLHWKDITDPKLREKMRKKAYYEKNKDWFKAYREVNKDKIKSQIKDWCEVNKQTINDKQKAYFKVNKDKIKLQRKAYREDIKDELNLRSKAYYKVNKDKIILKRKDYFKVNKDKILLKQYAYTNNRRKTNIPYKLSCNLRSRLNSAINNNYKSGSAVRDLGCTIEELKKYLESKFQPEMSWDNWTTDGWHIDHIKPLASFDLTDKNQLLEACHYTNLQPLWATDNITKSDKIL
jgi:hypothetical protein